MSSGTPTRPDGIVLTTKIDGMPQRMVRTPLVDRIEASSKLGMWLRAIEAGVEVLSLFAFSMMGLVLAPNFVQLFICWELVGLCSYLLIGYWYTKPEANAAAIKAFVVNRVGDFGFALGIFGLFAVFRTDSPIKGLIRQSEDEGQLKAKAEGSEYEFDNDAWQFGIDAWRNVGFGMWQRASLTTFT